MAHAKHPLIHHKPLLHRKQTNRVKNEVYGKSSSLLAYMQDSG